MLEPLMDLRMLACFRIDHSRLRAIHVLICSTDVSAARVLESRHRRGHPPGSWDHTLQGQPALRPRGGREGGRCAKDDVCIYSVCQLRTLLIVLLYPPPHAGVDRRRAGAVVSGAAGRFSG